MPSFTDRSTKDKIRVEMVYFYKDSAGVVHHGSKLLQAKPRQPRCTPETGRGRE